MIGRADAPRPNVLLLVSDDHGYGDMSCRGMSPGRTPGLDRLAAEGTVFPQGYVTAPICSPSRAALIAGQYQQRWGAHWFDSSAFAPADVPVLPELLRQAGYRTGYFGKVHYGPDAPGGRECPERHGFDESLYGLAAQSMGRLHYLHHSREAVERCGEEGAERNGVQPLLRNGVEVDVEGHTTQVFADAALEFIDDDSRPDDPFFCMLAFNAVHNFAWQLPDDELEARALPKREDFDETIDDYIDWYDGAISPNLDHGRDYYIAQLELMDRQIARVLEHLDERGLRESTLVVYLTDNGGSTCNYGDNSPLYGTKYTLFEGGVRVPFIVSWPGVIPAGEARDALVSSLDLAPTIARLAGVGADEAPTSDGQDLAPVWTGESDGHDVLHFDTGFQWAVRTRDWKLRWVDPASTARDALLTYEHADIGEGLTLVSMRDSADESEAADVSAQHPEVVAELTALRKAWLDGVGRA